MISSRRFQQNAFAAAAAMNRAAGAGGGSGYFPSLALVNLSTGTISQVFTTVAATDITNSSATFTLPRTSTLKIEVLVSFGVTAGTDFAYVSLVEDGTAVASAISGAGVRGYYTAPIFDQKIFAAGAHTFKLQGTVGATGTSGEVLAAVLFVYLLGA